MQILNPADIAPPLARYAHGVVVPAGWRLLRTAGQIGMRPDGTTPHDAGTQAGQCFANVAAILRDGGMGREDIVHVSAFLTRRKDLAGYMAARDALMAGVGAVPTSTLPIVAGFPPPEFLVEVEVWAART